MGASTPMPSPLGQPCSEPVNGPYVRRRPEVSVRALFLATLIVQVALAASLLASKRWPNYRIWPPPSARSWQFWFTWVGFGLSVVGTFVVGALSWGSLPLPSSARFVVGPALLLSGAALGVAAVRQLSTHASLGLGDELVRGGPYRYSRNPQYVADIAVFLGWALMSSSLVGLGTSVAGCLWFLLAPAAEEPWLRERFGSAYDSYCREVPRFVGARSSSSHAAAA